MSDNAPTLRNPYPEPGQRVTVKKRAFYVLDIGKPESGGINKVPAREGILPRLITLEAANGRQKGRQYSAIYRLETGEYENLIIY